MSTRFTFEQFANIVRHQGNIVFSPDGSHVYYISNRSGQYNLWRQPVDRGQEAAKQLTHYTEDTVRGVAIAPDGSTLLFMRDHHGNELFQLYLMPAGGGSERRISTKDEARYFIGGQAFTPDGEAFAYASTEDNPADVDVFRYTLATGQRGVLLAIGKLTFPIAWSPDGRRLLMGVQHLNTDSDVLLLELETREWRNLTEHEGEVVYMAYAWEPDGSGFYFISDRDREFKGLAFYDLTSDTWRWVETPDWDVEQADREGEHLAWTVNENGSSTLYVRNVRTGQPVSLPDIPRGVIEGLTFDRSGRQLAFYLADGRAPSALYVLDLTRGELRRLTENGPFGIPADILVDPEPVTYPTFDGRQVPAFLYKPPHASPDHPVPVVLSIHGGPEAQERPQYNYSGLYQYLVHRGIAVLAPNIRGSTGYGKTYQKLIHHDWGGAELKDIEAAARWLRAQPWVDAERLGIFGGSFGGFATLSAVSRLADYWAAAVDIVGPSNLVTFARTVPPFWKRFMARWLGDPETEADFLLERSPITYVHQIRAPLFIIQGANDPRVVKAESDQIVEKLRARGVPVRYDVYEDEGHGFTKKDNELKALGDTARFLEERLVKESGGRLVASSSCEL